jgi:hypothetical protein
MDLCQGRRVFRRTERDQTDVVPLDRSALAVEVHGGEGLGEAPAQLGADLRHLPELRGAGPADGGGGAEVL